MIGVGYGRKCWHCDVMCYRYLIVFHLQMGVGTFLRVICLSYSMILWDMDQYLIMSDIKGFRPDSLVTSLEKYHFLVFD